MMTLNRIQVEKLLKALPKVAERYFNGQMPIHQQEIGICFHTKVQYRYLELSNTAYHDISELLFGELGFDNKFHLENVVPTPKNWEQRATMCLFLAEFLKGEQK